MQIKFAAPLIHGVWDYATKTFMLEPGLIHQIGFCAPIARAFDPEKYPKYPGMNLKLAEDWNTADWKDGLTWDANFQSTDPVWEPSVTVTTLYDDMGRSNAVATTDRNLS